VSRRVPDGGTARSCPVNPPRPRLALAALATALALSACSAAPPGTDIWDPYEERNRRVHETNKALDRAVFGGPDTQADTGNPPAAGPLRTGISNFAGNLSLPRHVLNALLQGRIDAAAQNGFRLAINSTLCLGVLFDPATGMGLPGRPTDFGETLHVWGAPEGAYLELPLLGPSTGRDAVGGLVDLAIDPLNFAAITTRERNVALGARLVARLGDRAEYSAIVESTLYQSADSYAQARLLYLQNRRFELGATTDEDLFDPYEDLYD
jgi:phospholipid-binding lipoprotein MlaA